jgi:hypothetical protein
MKETEPGFDCLDQPGSVAVYFDSANGIMRLGPAFAALFFTAFCAGSAASHEYPTEQQLRKTRSKN